MCVCVCVCVYFKIDNEHFHKQVHQFTYKF